ncbi:DUF4177 domain-containing protein [Priestia endophytica]|uniref:DUF4177 domain-containing protein n=1 Tax=Priestia endophytica TaxID=135735 RepID=UPI002E1AF05C|nr:DUF4177 domain-containing protein [Priestia endophytica]
MYEYKFVQLELKHGFLKSTSKEDYREIINKHAEEGWRFVQIFAPGTATVGSAAHFELIFEKEK